MSKDILRKSRIKYEVPSVLGGYVQKEVTFEFSLVTGNVILSDKELPLNALSRVVEFIHKAHEDHYFGGTDED